MDYDQHSIIRKKMRAPSLTLYPKTFGNLTVAVASVSIVISLLLTQYIPNRFRIHPYPYLSDAGLRDPERIVISFSLALASVLFLPLVSAIYLNQQKTLYDLKGKSYDPNACSLFFTIPFKSTFQTSFVSVPSIIPCNRLPTIGLIAGISLAFSLAFFTAIPGWFYFHHIFALVFALSAGMWCSSYTIFSHALLQKRCSQKMSITRLPNSLRLLYMLTCFQGLVIAFFGLTWLSVKLKRPFAMIPNKDPRFVILAILEYIGTSSFLAFIAVVAADCADQVLEITLTNSYTESRNRTFRGAAIV